mmetsp:Transcript_30561/g.31043  ORF Transcript_30561/g.31043 Transcript_30561/m.31043 type:complete len:168 (-) Transcript_30561:12-515(-)
MYNNNMNTAFCSSIFTVVIGFSIVSISGIAADITFTTIIPTNSPLRGQRKYQELQQQQQYEIREDRWICFLRVRAGDGAIWIEDCDAMKSGLGGGYPGGMEVYTNLVEEFILPITKGVGLANCHKRKLKDPLRIIYELVCSSSSPSHHQDHRRKKQRRTKEQQQQQQ